MINRNFEIDFTENSLQQLTDLKIDPSRQRIAKAVVKSIGFMIENIRHPSLHTHKYDELSGPDGEEVFESYAQNKTPGAYRIFWYYGPGKNKITIIGITSHP